MRAGRKMRLTGVLTALVLATGLGTAVHAQDTAGSGTAIAIMQASAALQGNDCAGARAPLNLLWNDPYLDGADPDLAARMRASLIACIAQTDGLKAAIALSAENIKRPATTVAAFDMHIFLQLIDQQTPAAALTLQTALTRFPATAGELTDMSVMGVLLQVDDTSPISRQALLNRMQEVHWQAHNPAARPLIGLLRIEGLRSAVAAGDAVHADLYRTDIAADSLIYAFSQGDGELSDPNVAPIDVAPVIDREIREVQAYVSQSPTELLVLSYLMMLEQADNQNGLALTQLNGILALVDQYGLQNFQNIESYPGLLTDKASLLADQGRYIEADKAFKDGITILTPEAGIDHYLAYMNYLTDSGQETAALALEPGLKADAMDDSQRMQLQIIKACAYAYQGNEPGYATAMAALAPSPISKVKPALCAGDTEGAALALIAAINDPGSRMDVIMFLQNGLPSIAYGERDKVYVAAVVALKARPDVKAAASAAKVNIRTWPLRF